MKFTEKCINSHQFGYENEEKQNIAFSGTGNNNKINWTITDGQELIDIVETVYR